MLGLCSATFERGDIKWLLYFWRDFSDVGLINFISDTNAIPQAFRYISPFEVYEHNECAMNERKEKVSTQYESENSYIKPIASSKRSPENNFSSKKMSFLLRSANNTIHWHPNFTSPACLPLDFFYVYQVLQENDEIKEYGHVSIWALWCLVD